MEDKGNKNRKQEQLSNASVAALKENTECKKRNTLTLESLTVKLFSPSELADFSSIG